MFLVSRLEIYKIKRSYYKWNIESYDNTHTNKYLSNTDLTSEDLDLFGQSGIFHW